MTKTKCMLALSLVTLVAAAPYCGAQGTTKPKAAGNLRDDPAREEAFMDWGLGMFVHWSLDSQLGSVISHSMAYASQKYLDRYVNELPKTFHPDQYDPDKWMQIASLAGVKYMVLTTKHHSGCCMWDTETTDFSIMNTPYGKDIVREFVDACRRHKIKVGFYYSPEDFHYNYTKGIPARSGKDYGEIREELIEYTKRHLDELMNNYGDIDLVFLDGGHKAELAQYVHKIAPTVQGMADRFGAGPAGPRRFRSGY